MNKRRAVSVFNRYFMRPTYAKLIGSLPEAQQETSKMQRTSSWTQADGANARVQKQHPDLQDLYTLIMSNPFYQANLLFAKRQLATLKSSSFLLLFTGSPWPELLTRKGWCVTYCIQYSATKTDKPYNRNLIRGVVQLPSESYSFNTYMKAKVPPQFFLQILST